MSFSSIVQRAWRGLRRLPVWGQLGVGFFALVVLFAAASPGESSLEIDTEAGALSATTSSTERLTTTTERSPTTTRPVAPDGGFRTGSVQLVAEDLVIPDQIDRAPTSYADMKALEAVPVVAESNRPYARASFPHWDDVDGDGCDTRCEVLSAQRLADGSWFSEWDGATETDAALVHVDHVVSLAEAWRSGASEWAPHERDEFADDKANLLAVTEASNVRKGDHDASGWFPSRAEANCLWARTTVVVKTKWNLSVDPSERDALANLLTSCGATPPTTTTTTPPTTAPPTTVAPRTFAPESPPQTEPTNDCTPGYSPCLPPASDYDCARGSGNGPKYTGRVNVDHSYGDPYDLDRDGDGVGCEK